MQVRKMRILRLKYDISLTELSRACGLSKQRISEIELKTAPTVRLDTSQKIVRAFSEIMERRREKHQKLFQDFERHKGSLMDCVEEIGYEL